MLGSSSQQLNLYTSVSVLMTYTSRSLKPHKNCKKLEHQGSPFTDFQWMPGRWRACPCTTGRFRPRSPPCGHLALPGLFFSRSPVAACLGYLRRGGWAVSIQQETLLQFRPCHQYGRRRVSGWKSDCGPVIYFFKRKKIYKQTLIFSEINLVKLKFISQIFFPARCQISTERRPRFELAWKLKPLAKKPKRASWLRRGRKSFGWDNHEQNSQKEVFMSPESKKKPRVKLVHPVLIMFTTVITIIEPRKV